MNPNEVATVVPRINIERVLCESPIPVNPEAIDDVRRRLFGAPSTHGPRPPDHYELHEEIGRGQFGRVHRATDKRFPRDVALKLIPYTSARQLARVEREAHALASLAHPNVVTIFEKGLAGAGHYFLAMELVSGTGLDQWMREPSRRFEEILDVFAQAAEGLHHAHQHGFVHRDFKPSNAIVGAGPRLRLLDFGLAKVVEERSLHEQQANQRKISQPSIRSPLKTSGISEVEDLTGSASQGLGAKVEFGAVAEAGRISTKGQVLGTPFYAPPEQLEGRGVDSRGDQFSFCIALFEACYGIRPFSGNSLAELSEQIWSRTIVRGAPKWRGTRWLKKLLRRGLSPNPNERFNDLAEIARVLRGHIRPRVRPWMALAVGVGLTLGVWAVMPTPELSVIPKETLILEPLRPDVLAKIDEYQGHELRVQLEGFERQLNHATASYNKFPLDSAAWRDCLLRNNQRLHRFATAASSWKQVPMLPEFPTMSDERLWMLPRIDPGCEQPQNDEEGLQDIVSILFDAQVARLSGDYAGVISKLEPLRQEKGLQDIERGVLLYELGTALMHQRDPTAWEVLDDAAFSAGGSDELLRATLTRRLEAGVLEGRKQVGFEEDLARLQRRGASDSQQKITRALVHFGNKEFEDASRMYREAREAFANSSSNSFNEYMVAHCLLHEAFAQSNLRGKPVKVAALLPALDLVGRRVGEDSPLHLQYALNVAHVLRDHALASGEPDLKLLKQVKALLSSLSARHDSDANEKPSFDVLRLRAEELIVEMMMEALDDTVASDLLRRTRALRQRMDAQYPKPSTGLLPYAVQIRESIFLILANASEQTERDPETACALDAMARDAGSVGREEDVIMYAGIFDLSVDKKLRPSEQFEEIAERLRSLCNWEHGPDWVAPSQDTPQ